VHIPLNPTSVRDFGFEFNQKGELRNIETGEAYYFQNQDHYEALGEQVSSYVQQLMKNKYDFVEAEIPSEDGNEPHSNIFITKDWQTSEKLMVIVQGAGIIRCEERPGVWSRSLCIFEGLNKGSMIPYIERARKEEFGIIILNPNLNFVRQGNKKVEIRGSERPEKHILYVWDFFICKSKAKKRVFVSHSRGGEWTVELLKNREEALQRIAAIAFTDTRHVLSPEDKKNTGLMNFLHNRARNWVKSAAPVGNKVEDLYTPVVGCTCVSSGHEKHAFTSSSAFEDVFKFIEKQISSVDVSLLQFHFFDTM